MLNQLVKWLLKKLQRTSLWCRFLLRRTASTTSFNVKGTNHQVIDKMTGGFVANNVDQYVERIEQHFHFESSEAVALARFWVNWSNETSPPLVPELVIGGRMQESQRLLSWLCASPSPITVQADSVEISIVFLSAVIQSQEIERQDQFFPRALVVYSASSWQTLIDASEPLILIPRFERPEGIGKAVSNGHHVFLSKGRMGVKPGESVVSLPRIIRDSAQKALQTMGFGREKASSYATLARRSLPALRRELAITPGMHSPAWSHPVEARDLLGCLLASAWDSSSSKDREILSHLSGKSYDELKTVLARWQNEDDPPIRRTGNIWFIASLEDTFLLTAQYLTDSDLDRFETAAIDVLEEIDPKFSFPLEQRHVASVFRKEPSTSGQVRKGLCDVIALFASSASEVHFASSRTGEDVARSIIWQLMEKAKGNEQLWSSLAYQLPLLAEAAPAIFLQAVEEGLSGDEPVLVKLFQDTNSHSMLSGSSPHTGLLWALETVAWNPDYLPKAALCLARLARLDPGGQTANRPAKSLKDIFICCYLNTTAPVEDRITVLSNILSQEPQVSWRLLLGLLPSRHSAIVTPMSRTKWRNWTPTCRKVATTQEYIESTQRSLRC